MAAMTRAHLVSNVVLGLLTPARDGKRPRGVMRP